MKVAVLFSGGKDSHLAMYLASKHHDVVCAITMKSTNQYSYMFQSLGVEFTKLQLDAQGIKQLEWKTKGEKESELDDLKDAIHHAKKEFEIEGVVTGAIKSTYQSSRIQQICDDLDLWCFNPLWQLNSKEMLQMLEDNNFEISILGIFGYPLTKEFVGKKIYKKTQKELLQLEKKYQISAIGEGGEYESFVYNGPMYKYPLKVIHEGVLEDSINSAYVKEFRVEKK